VENRLYHVQHKFIQQHTKHKMNSIDELLVRREIRTIFDINKSVMSGQMLIKTSKTTAIKKIRDGVIELIMSRVDLPTVMVTEDSTGKYTFVSDILSVVLEYLNDGFKVKSVYPELDGKLFSELSQKHKNRIEDSEVKMCIIDCVRYDTTLIYNITNIIAR